MKRKLFTLLFLFASSISILAGPKPGPSEENGKHSSQAEVQSGFIDLDGDQIYYETAGEGDVIVLVHDGSLHHVTWDGQFPVLARKHRVVRYDRRGYGKSTYPEKSFSNIEDLHSVFEFLDIEKAAVIGMSAGGGLAIDFALEYPEKVTSLILVGAVVGGYGYTDHFLTRGGRLEAGDFNDPDKLIDFMFKSDPYTIYSGNTGARQKALKFMQENPHNYDFRKNRLLIGPKRPALGVLNEIAVPTLIVVGEYDIPDVHSHAGAIQAGIRNSERVVVFDAAHLVPLEKPDEFNTLALRFLKSTDFLTALHHKGTHEALRILEKLIQDGLEDVPFDELKINAMGYQYLQQGNTDQAIDLFKMNVLAYPDSWNTYDSLAEAYLTKGDRENAVKYYEKSVELNPDNTNGKAKLAELKKR